jgi:hypothetical protein
MDEHNASRRLLTAALSRERGRNIPRHQRPGRFLLNGEWKEVGPGGTAFLPRASFTRSKTSSINRHGI